MAGLDRGIVRVLPSGFGESRKDIRSDVKGRQGTCGMNRPEIRTLKRGAMLFFAIILLHSCDTEDQGNLNGRSGDPPAVSNRFDFLFLGTNLEDTSLWRTQCEAISERDEGTIFLKRVDGTWVGIGNNEYGRGELPAPPAGVGYVSVHSNRFINVASRNDHALVEWPVPAGADFHYGFKEVVTPWPDGASALFFGPMYRASFAVLSDGRVKMWSSRQFVWTGTAFIDPPSAIIADEFIAPPSEIQGVFSDPFTLRVLTKSGEMKSYGATDQYNWPPLDAGVSYVALAGCDHHRIGIRSDGRIAVAGMNQFGEHNVPTLPPGVKYVSASCSSDHIVALRSDGNLVAWGRSGQGQLQIPALPAGVTYRQAVAGPMRTTALRSDGKAVVWGRSSGSRDELYSPLVDAEETEQLEPVSGRTYAVALTRDGKIKYFCTGNRDIEWARDSGSAPIWTTPKLPPGVRWKQILGGYDCVAGLRDDGKVVSWSARPTDPSEATPGPATIPGEFIQIGGSADELLGLTREGNVEYYERQNGGAEWMKAGTYVPDEGERFLGIAQGNERDSAVPVWTNRGQIRFLGRDRSKMSPVDLSLPSGVSLQKVVILYRSLAAWLRTDGVVGAQLYERQVPTPPLPVGARYLDVSVSDVAVVALRSDGAVIEWGLDGKVWDVIPKLPLGARYIHARACPDGSVLLVRQNF
jgi:Regulator of chromosome condensation (RCC1) repeat